MTPGLVTPAGNWNDTIRSLEEALTSGDAEQVASIAMTVTLGPLPASLAGRAEAVRDDIARLEDQIGQRLSAIAKDLDRIPPRTRWGAPPAPSQLDCSA